MSIQVANIGLGSASVGQTGTIPPAGTPSLLPTRQATLQEQMLPPQSSGYTLLLFNESGCGLSCLWPNTQQGFSLPAGAWREIDVPAGEGVLSYTVVYVMTGAPVSQLLADLYAPGEQIDPVGTLGNSPVGGNTTTGVNTAKQVDDTYGGSTVTAQVEATVSTGLTVGDDGTNITLGAIGRTQLKALQGMIAALLAGSSVPASVVSGSSTNTNPWTGNLDLASGKVANVGGSTGLTAAPANLVAGPDAYGTETTTQVVSLGDSVVLVSDTDVILSFNAYWDGANWRFAKTGHFAGQVILNDVGEVGLTWRSSTVSGTAGQIISFSTQRTVAVLDSAGGGSAGAKVWDGTTDPGGSAGEGDIWLAG